MKCVHTIKCAKVRSLFAENKVRFARAEQLWFAITDREKNHALTECSLVCFSSRRCL